MSPICITIRCAWADYMVGILRGTTPTEFLARLDCFRAPQGQGAESELIRHLLAEDVSAAWAALRAWRRAYLQALAQVRPEAP